MAEDWARWQGHVVDGEFRLDRYLGGTEHSGVFLTEFGGRPAVLKLQPEQSRAEWGAGLSHPHLIRIYRTARCRLDDTLLTYIVMEYGDEVLSQVISERALTSQEARETLLPVLDALAYLHQEGFVHGHLKPSNILAAGERLKIATDGIFKSGETASSGARGPYDAPETTSGPVTPAADVWALGVTLVEILTQQLPVQNGTPVLPETLPGEFREIAVHCLDPDPERRWSLSDISEALSPAKPAPRPVLAMPAPRAEAEPDEPRFSPRNYVMAAIGVLVILAVFAVTFVFRPRTAVTPSGAAPPEASREAKPIAPAPGEEKPSPAGKVRGRVATEVKPDIPRKARETIQGTVKVRVTVRVDASGKVVEAKLDTPRVSRYFANASLQAARRWRFNPPTVEGRAVASSWILEFDLSRSTTAVHSRQIS